METREPRLLLKEYLKRLRLPAMSREFERVARDAGNKSLSYESFLLALAESITKTMAVCMRCGAPANRTQRLIASDERIVVGAGEAYEPRCRKCFRPPKAG